MAKCKCGSPVWRIVKRKRKRKGDEFTVVCLSCEWEWDTKADYAYDLKKLTREEIDYHMLWKYD